MHLWFGTILLISVFAAVEGNASLLRQDQNQALKDFRSCVARTHVSSLPETFACLPDDCTWTYMDSGSAQNSCDLVIEGDHCPEDRGFILPRVVLSCANGSFSPTYGFCVRQEAMEMATYQTPDKIFLYDLMFNHHSPQFTQMRQSDPHNECNTCHFYFDSTNTEPFVHSPIPLTETRILARDRKNPYILSLCETLRAADRQGCGLSGRDYSGAVSLDKELLLSFCDAITKEP